MNPGCARNVWRVVADSLPLAGQERGRGELMDQERPPEERLVQRPLEHSQQNRFLRSPTGHGLVCEYMQKDKVCTYGKYNLFMLWEALSKSYIGIYVWNYRILASREGCGLI